jgi:hypothetical protein
LNVEVIGADQAGNFNKTQYTIGEETPAQPEPVQLYRSSCLFPKKSLCEEKEKEAIDSWEIPYKDNYEDYKTEKVTGTHDCPSCEPGDEPLKCSSGGKDTRGTKTATNKVESSKKSDCKCPSGYNKQISCEIVSEKHCKPTWPLNCKDRDYAEATCEKDVGKDSRWAQAKCRSYALPRDQATDAQWTCGTDCSESEGFTFTGDCDVSMWHWGKRKPICKKQYSVTEMVEEKKNPSCEKGDKKLEDYGYWDISTDAEAEKIPKSKKEDCPEGYSKIAKTACQKKLGYTDCAEEPSCGDGELIEGTKEQC